MNEKRKDRGRARKGGREETKRKWRGFAVPLSLAQLVIN